MTRIGFAYNLKPDSDAPHLEPDGEAPRPDEEPPSRRRDNGSRSSASAAAAGAGALPSPLAPVAPPDDEFAEWDSEATVGAVERALAGLGEVVRLEATADFPEQLRAARPDIVFNMAEGLRGVNRESHVPAICEFFGVPYSGSDPFTLSLCLDKARTKEVLTYYQIPNAPFVLIRDDGELDALLSGTGDSGLGTRRPAPSTLHGVPASPESRVPSPRLLRLPLFVKPVHEGSSKGITERNLCRTRDELEAQVAFLLDQYAQPVLVEAFLPGAEFTCAVLGNGREAQILPIVQMNFAALPEGAVPIYSFEAKWLWDRPENPLDIFSCPARIDGALERRIKQVVLDAYRVLSCRDWSRIDVRLDAAGVPNVMEVNPLPGILPDPEDNSCFPKAARAAGMGYDELIQTCVRLAAERQGVALPPVAARRAVSHHGPTAAALG